MDIMNNRQMQTNLIVTKQKFQKSAKTTKVFKNIMEHMSRDEPN